MVLAPLLQGSPPPALPLPSLRLPDQREIPLEQQHTCARNDGHPQQQQQQRRHASMHDNERLQHQQLQRHASTHDHERQRQQPAQQQAQLEGQAPGLCSKGYVPRNSPGAAGVACRGAVMGRACDKAGGDALSFEVLPAMAEARSSLHLAGLEQAGRLGPTDRGLLADGPRGAPRDMGSGPASVASLAGWKALPSSHTAHQQTGCGGSGCVQEGQHQLRSILKNRQLLQTQTPPPQHQQQQPRGPHTPQAHPLGCAPAQLLQPLQPRPPLLLSQEPQPHIPASPEERAARAEVLDLLQAHAPGSDVRRLGLLGSSAKQGLLEVVAAGLYAANTRLEPAAQDRLLAYAYTLVHGDVSAPA